MSDLAVTHVPDLKGKLDWLLNVWGGDMPGWNYRVTRHQYLLAKALTELGVHVTEATISREWRRGYIPNLVSVAPKIGQIFRCDGQSFRRDDLNTFIEKTEGKAPSWGTLVTTAAVVGTVAALPPPAPALHPTMHSLHAFPDDMERDEDDDLPFLKPGERLEAVLPIPKVRPTVGDGRLYTLLFSGAPEGFLNWLPRGRSSKAFRGLDAVSPDTTEIRLPSFGGEIKIDPVASGKHNIVLVVTSERLPTALKMALEAKVENAELMPALAELAHWLAPRLHDGRAAIRRRPYFVKG